MIRGTRHPMPVEPPEQVQGETGGGLGISLMARIHNRWDVEVIDAATGKIRQLAQGFNVICNGWWTTIGAAGFPGYIRYGRGTGTPAASDTALFDHIGSKSVTPTTNSSMLAQEGYITRNWSVQLTISDAVGETITELGLATASTLCTHAMLQDMNGNPISIQKTDTDIVNIYATVFLHLTTDRFAGGKIRITDTIGWMFQRSTSNCLKMNPMRCPRNIVNENGVSVSSNTWNQATKTWNLVFSKIQVSSYNLEGGLFCLVFKFYDSTYQGARNAYLLIMPSGISRITAEAVGTGDGTTSNFKTAFAFPKNAKIYVDGVEQTSGISVFPDHPTLFGDLDDFMVPITVADNGSSKLALVKNSNSFDSINPGQTMIYENLLCETVAIDSLKNSSNGQMQIDVSDNLETWTPLTITPINGWYDIPSAYHNARYWKITASGNFVTLAGGKNNDLNGYAIRFDTPPAAGAIITADYDTPMIPKDSDHTMDMSLSITFGEYVGGTS